MLTQKLTIIPVVEPDMYEQVRQYPKLQIHNEP